MPTNVLIAGGGPAALEAALGLHRLAGDRVRVTLLAPEAGLVYRPLSVLAPFAAGGAPVYPLERIAADATFKHVRGRLASVDPEGHTVTTVEGWSIEYDALLIATGARPLPTPRGTISFSGSLTDQERVHGIVQDVEGGYLHRIAFVIPDGATWPIPLYELALMLAERAYQMGSRVELHVVTPGEPPLAAFGAEAGREVAELLAEAGITLHTDPDVVATLGADRVITVPRLEGPSIAGLPAGFLATDEHGRVTGVPDVYAAGDVTTFGVKHGGIACRQADAAAADIAARAGVPVEPEPFVPELRGLLVTERGSRALPDANGTPPAKIDGRELARYLETLPVPS